jgi:hypothetical protein
VAHEHSSWLLCRVLVSALGGFLLRRVLLESIFLPLDVLLGGLLLRLSERSSSSRVIYGLFWRGFTVWGWAYYSSFLMSDGLLAALVAPTVAGQRLWSDSRSTAPTVTLSHLAVGQRSFLFSKRCMSHASAFGDNKTHSCNRAGSCLGCAFWIRGSPFGLSPP